MQDTYHLLENAPLSDVYGSVVNDNDSRPTIPAPPSLKIVQANARKAMADLDAYIDRQIPYDAPNLPRMILRQIVGRPKWQRTAVGSIYKRRQRAYELADAGAEVLTFDAPTKTLSAMSKRSKHYPLVAALIDWASRDDMLRVVCTDPRGVLLVRIPWAVE